MSAEKREAASLEDSMERLEAIVSELEAGDQPLEQALARFEEGLEIGKRCREILDRAEARVRKLVDVDEDGEMITEDEDDE